MGQARSRMGAYNEMVNYLVEAVGRSKVKVAYVHAGALEETQKLKGMVEAQLDVAESLIAELSPALAVHTGPGTAGLCFYPVDVLPGLAAARLAERLQRLGGRRPGHAQPGGALDRLALLPASGDATRKYRHPTVQVWPSQHA